MGKHTHLTISVTCYTIAANGPPLNEMMVFLCLNTVGNGIKNIQQSLVFSSQFNVDKTHIISANVRILQQQNLKCQMGYNLQLVTWRTPEGVINQKSTLLSCCGGCYVQEAHFNSATAAVLNVLMI